MPSLTCTFLLLPPFAPPSGHGKAQKMGLPLHFLPPFPRPQLLSHHPVVTRSPRPQSLSPPPPESNDVIRFLPPNLLVFLRRFLDTAAHPAPKPETWVSTLTSQVPSHLLPSLPSVSNSCYFCILSSAPAHPLLSTHTPVAVIRVFTSLSWS